jgi:hypothetical protein
LEHAFVSHIATLGDCAAPLVGTPSGRTYSEQSVRLTQKMLELADAFLKEYIWKKLKLAQLLGQLGVFLA